MKKILLLLLISVLFSFNSVKADHFKGGEITWECLTSGPNTGKFVFHLIIYRDCAGAELPPTGSTETITVIGCPSVSSITMNWEGFVETSPVCDPTGCTGNNPITCATTTLWNYIGTSQERRLVSNPITITGVPPSTGWIFYWSSCCRNVTANLDPASVSHSLRAIMYPYNNQNTNPCFDSSPKFLEKANSVICAGYLFNYNNNGSDLEQDILNFEWAQPLESVSGSLNYAPWKSGYSTTSQLPSTTQNINNIAAVLNDTTGEITFKSLTTGDFVTCIKVQSFRCGILIAEVFREIQVSLLVCPLPYPGSPVNNPPTVNKPFYGGTQYDTTVYAGDSVCFNILAEDYDEKCALVFQNVTIQASGSQFGTNYSSSTAGCLNPPCATLDPPPGDPLVTSVVNGTSSRFCWQTECGHVGFIGNICNVATSKYVFIIRVLDDFCPAPGLTMLTVSVEVKDRPKIKAPDFHCTEVLPNGNVKLTWEPVVDTAESFKSYIIWGSPSKYGLYNPLATLNGISQINTSSFIHTGVNANLAPYYYFMQTVSGCFDDTRNSDTLSTIFLNITPTPDPDGVIASMTWNSVSVPNLPTNLGMYYIYRDIGSGYVLIDSVFNPTDTLLYYQDPSSLAVCYDNVSYRIEVADAIGCRSVSNIDTELIGQQAPPAQPVLSSVTVLDAAGAVMINWAPNTEGDLLGYTILCSNTPSPIGASVVATVPTTNHTYINPLVNTQPQYYFVYATDTCGHIGDTSLAHVSIYLDDSLDKCEGKIELAWNNYINWDGGVDHYEVYVQVGSGNLFNLYSSTASLEELVGNLVVGSDYCIYIQAFGAGASAGLTVTSNIVCLTADLPNFPEFLYIRSASVVDKSVELTVHVDADAQLKGYNIYRGEKPDDFSKIAEVLPAPTPLIYTDEDIIISTDKKSYYYKVTAIGICGTEVLTSNTARTVHMATAADDNYIYNNIYWNEYEGWPTGVDYYNLYRSESKDATPTLIATLPSDVLSYHDDISELVSGSGEFCYLIEAVENDGNTYLFKDISYSNEFCMIQHPTIFVPSAFNPNGVNKEFVPVSTFLELSDYQFMIFNRWGQEVFSSNKLNEGWDGANSDAGVYVYLVKFTSTQGIKMEKRGTVTLLR